MAIKDPVCSKVNAGELARVFGVSRKWVYNLTERGMPREGRLYDVATCVQWYLASITERGNDEPKDIMEARKRLYTAQTTKTRLECDRLKGRLVDLDEAEGLLQRIATVVASQLDAVGPRIAAEVAHLTDQKTVQQILFNEHRDIRRAVADAIMELPGSGGGHHQAAADEDGEPVGRREADTTA